MTEDIISLLDNTEFKLWILSPTESQNQYWEKMADDSPDKRESIEKARLIFSALHKEFQVDFPKPETVNGMLRRILNQNE